ncbi:hypothetical protein EU537_12945 [Candidatus Thorarchaeota archaeon]|nr:MAG: hypothetical protein EU537_12945 [Candidatus Thorarchaeota archaeon]
MNNEKVWGFEGCGCMWTFFKNRDMACSNAGDNTVWEVTLERAYELDNKRRQELDFDKITLEEFKECVDHPMYCNE